MEDMDAAAVASWLRGLGLEAAAVAAEREGVDGYLLVALAADDAGLQDGLGVTATLDAAKIRAGLARLANKRPAAGAAGAADPKRQRVSLPASPLLPPGAAAASLRKVVDDKSGRVFVSAPSENLSCAICCAVVMHDAHVLKFGCTHSFCRTCLLQCLAEKRECPKCKRSAQPAEFRNTLGCCDDPQCTECVDGSRLVERNTDLCGVIDAQLVHCPRGVMEVEAGTWICDPDGCPATLPIEGLAAHAAVCPHEPVACPMAAHGCGWKGKRMLLTEHEGSCEFVKLRPFIERSASDHKILLQTIEGQGKQLQQQSKQLTVQNKQMMEQKKKMLEQNKQIEEQKAALASSQEMGQQLATLQGVVERERQAIRGSQAQLRTQSIQLSTLRSELGRNTQQQNLELCTYLVRLGVRLPQWVECEIVAAVEAKVIQSGDKIRSNFLQLLTHNDNSLLTWLLSTEHSITDGNEQYKRRLVAFARKVYLKREATAALLDAKEAEAASLGEAASTQLGILLGSGQLIPPAQRQNLREMLGDVLTTQTETLRVGTEKGLQLMDELSRHLHETGRLQGDEGYADALRFTVQLMEQLLSRRATMPGPLQGNSPPARAGAAAAAASPAAAARGAGRESSEAGSKANAEDLEREHQLIEHQAWKEQKQARVIEGESWFLVPASWYAKWRNWAENGGSGDISNPGSIDFSSIAESDGQLRNGLSLETHYMMVSADTWAVLKPRYGSGREIERKAIYKRSAGVVHKFVPIYPMRVSVRRASDQVFAAKSVEIFAHQTLTELKEAACSALQVDVASAQLREDFGDEVQDEPEDMGQTLARVPVLEGTQFVIATRQSRKRRKHRSPRRVPSYRNDEVVDADSDDEVAAPAAAAAGPAARRPPPLPAMQPQPVRRRRLPPGIQSGLRRLGD